jgi:transposase
MATWSDAAATIRLATRCATGSCPSPRRRRGQRDFRAGDCGGCGAIFGSLLRNSMWDDRDRAWRSGGARQFWNRRCDADEGAARGEGRDVIAVPSGVRILVATKPVDFRRGADSLAALAKDELQRDPFSRTILVFRSKRADRLKILAWDGSGLILYWKRLEEGAFRWPPISDGVMRLSASQLAALVDGLDWSRLYARDILAPDTAS